jgi:putative addiction module killer protein
MFHEIRHYLSADGADPYQRWLDGLEDLTARVAILRRVDRISAGNFGDHKYLRDGVWELRLDVSGGIRVYYGLQQRRVILLVAGRKRSQRRDLERAIVLWKDFLRRSG